MKSEKQKKPRACTQKRRLAQKRRNSQAITLRSGRGRSMVRVCWPVLVNAVIFMILSFCLFEFGSAASVARPLLRANPQKGSRTGAILHKPHGRGAGGACWGGGAAAR